jgi:hypothetical protein
MDNFTSEITSQFPQEIKVFSTPRNRGVGQGQLIDRGHKTSVKGKNLVPNHGSEGGFFPVALWAAAGFSCGFCDVFP